MDMSISNYLVTLHNVQYCELGLYQLYFIVWWALGAAECSLGEPPTIVKQKSHRVLLWQTLSHYSALLATCTHCWRFPFTINPRPG